MRLIRPEERFVGSLVTLRLLALDDCTETYVAWLEDEEVKRFLETRWNPQTLASVRSFVAGMVDSPDSYLFAILERASGRHVGNIKVGPIHARHGYADVSYFIGDRAAWGKGLATEAIRIATGLAFARLGLHRVQAGLYASNVGSGRALEKVGYSREGVQRRQLRLTAEEPGVWEDHVWYGLLRSEWPG